MKRTIRLSESDLHRVIAESVKRYLTELDWRTMASASQKARERGDNRSDYFAQGATDEFNRTHSSDRTYNGVLSNNGEEHSTLNYKIYPNGYDSHFSRRTNELPRHKAPAMNYDITTRARYNDDGSYDLSLPYDEVFDFDGDMVDYMPNYTEPDSDDSNLMKKNERELENFYTKKAQYKPGKGWRQR